MLEIFGNLWINYTPPQSPLNTVNHNMIGPSVTYRFQGFPATRPEYLHISYLRTSYIMKGSPQGFSVPLLQALCHLCEKQNFLLILFGHNSIHPGFLEAT